ncbi:cadherin-12a isoform X2 [Brachyhypopomus gauderio]
MLRAQAVDVLTGKPLEPESQFIIKVQDINDNEPRFLEGPYSASVPEMSPIGTYVMQVTATDADDPTYGNSARIVYSILHGQPYFSVDPKTGVIRIALPNMDREVKESYQVLIQAKDMGGQLGGLAGTTTVNITLTDINDNPPRFAKSILHLHVPESAAVMSSVGRVKAHDLDLGKNAQVDYAIVPGDGSSTFDIYTDEHTQEGVVVLKKPLDYESRKVYSFRVEASNAEPDAPFLTPGTFKDSATVRVSVLDVEEPPVFGQGSYGMEVYEDSPVGIVIGAVTAEDLDTGDSPIRYSIEWRNDSENYFDIDPTEGTISTREALDRERTASHNVTVVATKVNNPLLFSRVSIAVDVLDVNEFPPELSFPYEMFVCEDAKVGQVIQVLRATDRDLPHTGHRFFFKSPKDIRNRNFTIRDYGNNTAGVVTRRAGLRQTEAGPHLVPVVVEDSGYPVLSSTATLSVRVCACTRDDSGAATCGARPASLPAGLSTGALVAVPLCLLVLLGTAALHVALKRHKKTGTLMSSEEDVRDNVIHYDDEGGGEEDTRAFDIGTLRHSKAATDTPPRGEAGPKPKPRPPAMAGPPPADGTDLQAYIQRRLQENHSGAGGPPYDSLATYAYEGEGSVAGSLSSIESRTQEPEQDYSHITDWGPHFKTLARIFSGPETQTTDPHTGNKPVRPQTEGSEEGHA